MSTTLRRFTILTALVLLALVVTCTSHASASGSSRPQPGAPESQLLEAANRDRASAGLLPLQWDVSLAAAARQHAQRMAQTNTLSHQFPGEPPVQQRATQAGARFSLIAENVAEGPSAAHLHQQWMNSAPHRANLLDPELNAVGIAVVQSGGTLFAVEDFSTAVPTLNLDAQELQVAAQLSAHGLRMVNATADARKTCDMDRGWSGQRPASVVRYETSDLSRLPDDVAQKLGSGKFHTAAVGACDAGSSAGFTRFRIAILLF
jgi:cysteine-rich secretory family protein